ncbi:MAG: TolC family protein [Candidatus Kapaibacteriales bacterium]
MRIILFILIILSGLSLHSQEVLTFGKAVEEMLLNNYGIKLQSLQYEIAQNNLDNKYGQSGALPTVNTSAGLQYQNLNARSEFADPNFPPIDVEGAQSITYSAGARLDWTLFDGFAMFASINKIELLEEKGKIQLQIEIENQIKQLASTYYNAMVAKSLLDIQRETLAQTSANLERVKLGKEYGQVGSNDVLRIEVNYNADTSRILETKLQLENAKRALIYNLGRKQYDISFDIGSDAGNIELPALEKVRSEAQNSNTAIRQSLLDEEITEKDYEIIVAQYYPRVNAFAGYNYLRNENEGNFVILNQNVGLNTGLNLEWNLFNGFQTRTAQQNAEVAKRINDVATQNIRSLTDLNLINAYENLKQRLELLEIEEESLKSAENNYRLAQERFGFGGITALELRDAQLQLLSSQNSIVRNRYLAKLAEIELNILAGKLNPMRE